MRGEPVNKKNQNILLGIRVFSDMLMVSGAWMLAFYLRFSPVIEAPKGVPATGLYVKLVPFICVIWLLAFSASGFYRRTGKHRTAFIEALDILQSCGVATLAFIAFSYFYEEYRYSRLTLVFFALIHPWMIILGRSAIRKALRYHRRNSPARATLIIGSGDNLQQAIAMSDLGDINRSEVSGVILIGDTEQVTVGRKICEEAGLKMINEPSDWTSFFAVQSIQSVLIALPYRQFAYVEEHLEKIVDQVPDVRLVPDISRFARLATGIELVAGMPVISIHESPLAGMGGVLKRLTDILGALLGLVLFAPVLILLSVLVKLTSPGPVFYGQERMGLDGRTFRIWKFRSMRVDAEEKTGAVWAKKGDDRTTWLGSLMRRTSLDELPQLLNVLLGEMSLVGPRPERPVFVHQFRRSVPGYMLRHKVKAGLTGWAQVNGWRGDTSIDRRIECDLYYIQHWSFWLDLRIIFLTVLRGFIHKNAH